LFSVFVKNIVYLKWYSLLLITLLCTTWYKADNFEQVYEVLPEDGV